MGNRRLTSLQRRKEILDIALEIIFNQGFSNLTIKNIAEKIKLTEAAIYRHFKSKKEIIECLVDLVFKKNQIDDPVGDPAALLKEIMFKRIEQFKKEPRMTAITFQEEIFSEYPDIRDKFKQQWKTNEGILLKIIERGQKEGFFSPDVNPKSFVLIYMGSMRMILYQWKRDNFSQQIDKIAPFIIKDLFKILEKE
ncbi:MAG: TetR/AcrR family transcriptional regulator [Halanaerobiales bacterium]|nr:TetR/AcrR family transcriptional regulator [Halanaerobiales bacterium]